MQRIVVTGASRGIGRAIAERLAEPGKKIVIHGRDTAALDETAAAVRAKGAEAMPITGDLSSAAGVEEVLRQIEEGPIDALINNAGISVVAPVEEITVDQWEKTLAVNVTAPFLLVQLLLPMLGDGATIINMLSVANKASFPGWAAYTMSKAALEGFSRILREELRPKGIRVVDLYPAATATDLWDSVPGEWSREAMLPPTEVAEAVAYVLGRPEGVLLESLSVGKLGGNL